MSKNIDFESLQIDHRDFAEGADEFIERMQSTDTELMRAPNELGSCGVYVALTDARQADGDPTVIVPRAFQAFMEDPFEQQRDKAIAVAMNARVIGVDTPGVGLSRIRSRSGFDQKLEAIKGRIDTSAAAQLLAIRSRTGLSYENEPVRYWGYSMGAWSVAAMVGSPQVFQVEGVDLPEAVNDQPWGVVGKNGLPSKIGAEDESIDHYLEQNFQYPELLQPYDRFSEHFREKIPGKRLPVRMQSLLLGMGMRKPFAPGLVQAIEADKRAGGRSGLAMAPINLYKAEGSGVSRLEANEATAEQLRKVHPNVGFFVMRSSGFDIPLSHNFYHSVPNVAILASAIARARR
ncbi:hypothetical protein HY004_02865 [Candidatus Saccharibacteria bacterium]|nr:hypothetical protein [Candidatus Saccharibacteria bacterium]